MLTSGADIVGWEKKGFIDIWGLFLGGNRFKLGDTIGDWLSILTRSPNFFCFILWLFFSNTDNQLWIMESGCLLIMPLPTRKNGFEIGGFELLASKACYLSASLPCQSVNLWGCESLSLWLVATLNPGDPSRAFSYCQKYCQESNLVMSEWDNVWASNNLPL